MVWTMNFEALLGKEVVVWPRAGEPFLLCTQDDSGGIVPLVGRDENGGPKLQLAPFVAGTVTKVGDDLFGIRYRMPDGRHYIMALNAATVATITFADPANKTVGSKILVGV